ncbi:hypothetical protein BGW36DRAFT_353497 [Talaromyces proteolyticus]|uniref:Uncharacterized protein n=1 Tax=Talaromyces proteolyticus TaxID=1131652 RepID=A0AAD4Q674_9EURO|nr:uncharacterized protein BGW36DRAFT_353497 [Talaromyces proteolyticus]KAH8705072.1 hypothetical protein BGW36DRAFT_353497 [Talaromyces proteolyticus]
MPYTKVDALVRLQAKGQSLMQSKHVFDQIRDYLRTWLAERHVDLSIKSITQNKLGPDLHKLRQADDLPDEVKELNLDEDDWRFVIEPAYITLSDAFKHRKEARPKKRRREKSDSEIQSQRKSKSSTTQLTSHDRFNFTVRVGKNDVKTTSTPLWALMQSCQATGELDLVFKLSYSQTMNLIPARLGLDMSKQWEIYYEDIENPTTTIPIQDDQGLQFAVRDMISGPSNPPTGQRPKYEFHLREVGPTKKRKAEHSDSQTDHHNKKKSLRLAPMNYLTSDLSDIIPTRNRHRGRTDEMNTQNQPKALTKRVQPMIDAHKKSKPSLQAGYDPDDEGSSSDRLLLFPAINPSRSTRVRRTENAAPVNDNPPSDKSALNSVPPKIQNTDRSHRRYTSFVG